MAEFYLDCFYKAGELSGHIEPCPLCGKEAYIRPQYYTSPFSDCMSYMQIGCDKCGLVLKGEQFEMQHPDGANKLRQDTQRIIKVWNHRSK